MPKKLTTEQFVAKVREIHGDKYDYSKVVYVNAKTKVCIICEEHGCGNEMGRRGICDTSSGGKAF